MMSFFNDDFRSGHQGRREEPFSCDTFPSGALVLRGSHCTVKRKAEMQGPDSAAKFLTGGSQTQTTETVFRKSLT